MSPSKLRKTSWYRDGEMALHLGYPYESNPYRSEYVYSDKRRAWNLGWREAADDVERCAVARARPSAEEMLAVIRTLYSEPYYSAAFAAACDTAAAIIARADA